MRRIIAFLSPPVFQSDEAQNSRAQILYGMLLALLTICLVAPVLVALRVPVITGQWLVLLIVGELLAVLAVIGLMFQARLGRVRVAGGLASLLLLLVVTGEAALFGGLRGPAAVGYALTIMAAGLLLEGPGIAAGILLSALASVGLYLGEQSGILPLVAMSPTARPADLPVYLTLLASAGALAFLAGAVLRASATRVRAAEQIVADQEATIQSSELRFRAVVDNTMNAVGVSVNGINEMVNPACVRMFGYDSEEEMVGRPATDMIAPAERERIASMIRSRTAGNPEPVDYMTRGMRKDGSQFDMHVRVSSFQLNGRLHHLVGLRDITAERQAERALRESEAHYRSLFHESPVPMWIYDLHSLAFLAVNESAVAHYGYSEEEFLSMTIRDIRPADDIPRLMENLREVMEAGGLNRAGIWRHIKKDGSLIYVDVTSRMLTYNGRPAEMVQIRDVTESWRTYETLATERTFLRQVIDAVPAFIFVKNEAGRFDLVNWALASAYGTTVEDLTGRSDADYNTNPAEVEKFLADDRLVMTTRQPQLIREEPVTYASGDLHWLTTIKVPLVAADGTCTQVLGVSTDITARKEAEAEILRLNAELEQRVIDRTTELRETIANLESFSYSVSHDLRAPLRVLSGFAEILLEDTAPRLQPEEIESLQIIHESATKMSRMIDGLLAFSRLGRQALTKEPVDTPTLVRSVLRDLDCETAGRMVEFDIAPLPPCTGDPGLLRQVWFNLLSNALKFTRGREPARISVGCRSGENNETVYYVRDNGAGFDPRYAERLFGVFQRLHRAEDFEGTGVGLAIVHRIVRRHGGQIWAEAKPGEGATFHFTVD